MTLNLGQVDKLGPSAELLASEGDLPGALTVMTERYPEDSLRVDLLGALGALIVAKFGLNRRARALERVTAEPVKGFPVVRPRARVSGEDVLDTGVA